MQSKYVFREITEEEIPLMFQIIVARMKWMDAVGIKQWNVTKYDEVYPIEYYEEKRRQGEVYVLEDTHLGQIVCVGVLKKEDDRWPDNPPALYLHNFATKIGEKGVGKIYIRHAEALAKAQNKIYFRLDSADDNIPLAKYYENQGYLPAGHCIDGMYTGILRQKRL